MKWIEGGFRHGNCINLGNAIRLSMKKTSLLLFLAIACSFGFATHKFYVSVTNINYSEKDDAFQITTRIFIDDLEQLLEERYGVDAQLGTDQEAVIAGGYIEKYFKAKLLIQLNGEQVSYRFLGKKYVDDVVICYLEIEQVNFDTLKSLSIQNEILTDLFDEQQNLVHVKWLGQKKSFILIKENNKGMLNL